jgi:branched-chain amino acid transport system ATP-binding protein
LALSLSIQGVEAGYGAVRALHGVSLDLKQGETVALLGTNGNGKSTLLKCVMGLVRPTRGDITLGIDGQSLGLVGMATEKIVGLGFALVPEGRRLFPKLTVEENLLLGAFRPAARGAIEKNLQFCYASFAALKEGRRQQAGNLSGGQQQMLAIARALMSAPRVLLVDEPSVGLSPLLIQQTVSMIKRLKDSFGLTVLMAEQNFQQAIRIADRGYIIVHGEIVFEGSADALRDNEIVKSLYLGA